MLTIKTGIPEASQEANFMNATLQGVGDDLAASIAIYLPHHLQDLSQAELADMMQQDFKYLTDIGYSVEIQIGFSRG